MFVPRGLVLIVVILVASFFLSLVGFIRRQKQEEAAYQKIPNNKAGAGGIVANRDTAGAVAQQSYQNSAVTSDYALPMERRVVAYCVIDGRLVDQSE